MVVGECAKTGARTKKREGGRGGGQGEKGADRIRYILKVCMCYCCCCTGSEAVSSPFQSFEEFKILRPAPKFCFCVWKCTDQRKFVVGKGYEKMK